MAVKKNMKPWILALFLTLSAACVHAPYEIHPLWHEAPAQVHLSVPFFSDNSDQCGPSTLASVMNFWGKPVTPANLKKEIYLPSLKGTLPMDMLPAVRAHGLEGEVKNGDLDALRLSLAQGHPVIAYLNFGTGFYPIGHYVVVTGFDDPRRGLFVHSGPSRDKFVSYGRFIRGWKKTDRWMLVVTPPKETKS